MKLKFIILLVIILLFPRIIHGDLKPFRIWEMTAFYNSRDNTCENKRLGFVIRYKYEYMPDAVGRYDTYESMITISPEDPSFDTIAHETYHMVQSKRFIYGIYGQEQGAWMQGSFTQCGIKAVRQLQGFEI